jgi:hypothetical protein
MSALNARLGIVGAASTFIFGCGQSFVILPDNIAERGLLVGQVCSASGPEILDGEAVVDGVLMNFALREGLLTVPLRAGAHSIASLSRYSPEGSSMYIAATLNVPIWRDFATKAYIDNTRDTATLLQDIHPNLYASLQDKNPTLATHSYSDAKQLENMRQAIANQKAMNRHAQADQPGAQYVGGCAGTLARLTRDTGGKVTGVRLLPSNTIADLTHCTQSEARAVCAVSKQEYLLVEGDTVTRQLVPPEVKLSSAYVTERGGIVLVDAHMNIYESRDRGESWKKHSDAAFAQPLHKQGSRLGTNFGFARAQDGFYVYSMNKGKSESVLVFADYQTQTYRKVEIPQDVAYLVNVHVRESGLHIGPQHSELAKGKIHLQARNAREWQVRELPQARCSDIAFTDKTGQRFQVECVNDAVWNTSDGGLTWNRIFRKDSVFQP